MVEQATVDKSAIDKSAVDNAAADTDVLPLTGPHVAPIFDTGPHPLPLPALTGPLPAGSVALRGQFRALKWWQLPLVLAAVWVPAAGIGLGLFSWWYSLADKTPAVFAVLVYAVMCIVAGLVLAMVGRKPVVSALAIAVMSAVFASGVAVAPLYGHHYCHHVSRCLAGILPY